MFVLSSRLHNDNVPYTDHELLGLINTAQQESIRM